MLCFFCMGFVDLVGIASNYVKEDLHLNDSTANIFPSLVFFWFLIFSVPTGMLMNKIGRKKTVLLSLVVTLISLALPLFGENFGIMLVAFSSKTWLRVLGALYPFVTFFVVMGTANHYFIDVLAGLATLVCGTLLAVGARALWRWYLARHVEVVTAPLDAAN